MSGSQVNKHNETKKTDDSARNAKLTPQESLDKALKAAQHITHEHNPAANSIKQVAKQLSEALAKITELENKIHTELASHGAGSSHESTAQLQSDLKQAKAQLSALKDGVTKFNSAMASQGSHHRLKVNGSKIEFTAVSAGQAAGKSKDAKAAHHTHTEAAAMATDAKGSPTLDVNQKIHPGVEKTPFYHVLKTAVQATAAELAAKATKAGTAAPTTEQLKAHASHIHIKDMAATGGEGVGATSAGQGVGGPTQTPFYKNLKQAASGQKTGGAGAAGGKGKAGGKGHVGSLSASASGAAGGAGGSAAAAHSSSSLSAADTAGLDAGTPGGSLTSAASGDPYAGYPNINGLLMAVLLQCYKSGQDQLKEMALRLKDTNKKKDAMRAQLKGLRTADKKTADANPTSTTSGPSVATQAAEDKLNSLGDDAQLQQMDLQNLAQNQSQLLQMISDFSKNTNTNSLAIIRNIAG
jgi:hypothetical protein